MTPKQTNADRRIIRERIRTLTHLVRRVVRRVDGEDAVQKTVFRVWRKHPRIEVGVAYVQKVAANVAIDHYRRERARGGGRSIALEDAYDAPALSYLPDQESALLLKQVVLALPPLYRDVFILNRFMGMTYAEIAAKYGLSVKAVEYRMSRALALCEEALRD